MCVFVCVCLCVCVVVCLCVCDRVGVLCVLEGEEGVVLVVVMVGVGSAVSLRTAETEQLSGRAND